MAELPAALGSCCVDAGLGHGEVCRADICMLAGRGGQVLEGKRAPYFAPSVGPAACHSFSHTAAFSPA